MHLEALLELPEFHLPVNNTSGKSYVMYAEEKLTSYINYLRSSSADLFTNSPPQIMSHREYLKEVERFAKGLISVIRLAKANNIVAAWAEFKSLMEKAGMFMFSYDDAIKHIRSKDIFYRCKFDPDNGPLKSQEFFFHTPFEKNNLVAGTRFAAPGYPALYLANSVIGGYIETRATTLYGFQGVKIRPTELMSFINLDYNAPDIGLRATKPEEYDLQLQIKGLIYPFLFCCYSQQNTPSAAAAQEYIIPQFLLKWVRDTNRSISGIRYPSTRIDNPHYHGTFYNLIIPPIVVEDSGICPELRKKFQMSEVAGYTQNEAEIRAFYLMEFSKSGIVNPDITSIDWKSLLEMYNTSEIGQMEFYLKNRHVADISL